MARFCENVYESSDYVKGGELLDKLSKYFIVKKEPPAWSGPVKFLNVYVAMKEV
jgi:hypothetical protein